MATAQISYTWPEGGNLSVAVSTKVRNPAALEMLRVEAKDGMVRNTGRKIEVA